MHIYLNDLQNSNNNKELLFGYSGDLPSKYTVEAILEFGDSAPVEFRLDDTAFFHRESGKPYQMNGDGNAYSLPSGDHKINIKSTKQNVTLNYNITGNVITVKSVLDNGVPAPSGGSIKGFVKNDNGVGLANIQVYNDADNDHNADVSELKTVTASDGSYSFTNLTAGPYKIRAMVPSDYTQVTPVTPEGAAYYGITITLKDGQNLTNQNFVFAKVSNPDPGPEPIPSGEYKAKGLCFTANPSKISAANAIKMLRDTGTDSIRIWGTTDLHELPFSPTTYKYIAELKAANISTVALITIPEKKDRGSKDLSGSYTIWKDLFKRVRDSTSKHPDFYEIINEVNLTNYWEWGYKKYVDDVLHAAWDVFHPAGIKVVGGSTTASRTFYTDMWNYGYKDLCDYANIHPYDTSTTGQENTVKWWRELTKSLPAMCTEWSFQGQSDKNLWCQRIKTNYQNLKKYNIYALYYFYYIVYNSPAGAGGLLKTNNVNDKNQPFYDTFKSLK